ncbi:MAG: hypothetical protein IJJ14_08175 [Coriobacteriales bacterium]|nr:hypothetical protein [Coriobacteriales bacterium]MBQ6586643.1 hypothetical protein [Coriobacteriales bacterium]
MAAFEGALTFSAAAQAKMDDQGFTEADVRQAIGTALETGQYLRNEDSTEFIAKVKIDETYIYAQYKVAGDGYEVVLAYALKTWIEGW